MLPILQFIVKNGLAAATKKFGTVAVKQAIKKPSKGKPKKAPSKPSPKRSDINPLTGKSQPPKAKAKGSTSKPKTKPKAPKRPSEKATKTPGKPKTKSKGIGDFLGEMFGRKRTGKTPKRSDSQAYRDGLKAGQKKADEKLNPSLRNKEMAPRSISNRRSDVAEQLRDIKKAGGSPKDVARLEARLRNLKDMAKDRPDLTTMRGRFSGGGVATHTDLRGGSGLFKSIRPKARPKSITEAEQVRKAMAHQKARNKRLKRESGIEARSQRGKAIDEAISGIVNKPGKRK